MSVIKRILGPLTPVVAFLLLSGCDGDDERRSTATAAVPKPAARVLPASWYEDPDGDLVPTAVERELGTDPAVDECARKAGCGAGGDSGGAVSAVEMSNMLLILDSSGSMKGSAGGGLTKIEAAKRALRRYVAGTPDNLALGFMVYGHKGSNLAGSKAASCAGVELLDPIGTTASKRFDRTLRRFKPTGYTPLAAALRKAREAFAGKEDAINRIILVTDGVETCGGNPVLEARRLKRAGIGVTTDVIGFDVAKPTEARRLRAIATASGGTYANARDAAALDDALGDELRRNREAKHEFLCVLQHRALVGACQANSVTRATIYMNAKATRATIDGQTARSAEIERLRKRMTAASDKRHVAYARRTDVERRRLQREIDDAAERLHRLGY